MRSAIPRLALLWLALGFTLSSACECPGPAPCPDPPNCDLPACEGDRACTPNGEVEDCGNHTDDDGDGYFDEHDPDCVDAISPSDGTDCTGEEITTTAGDDTDAFTDPADCGERVVSDSGDGDTVEVQVTQGAGVVLVNVAITENGTGTSPTAEITIETETPYEANGDYSRFVQIDPSPTNSLNAAIQTIWQSRGYTGALDGITFGDVPTLPDGGSYTGNTTIYVEGDGSPTSSFDLVLGTGLSADGDGDGASNFNDPYCPHSEGPVDASGCALSGTYPPHFVWYCNVAPPAGVCSFNPPTPGFCQDCAVVVDDVVASAPFEGHVTVTVGDALVCENCELDSFSAGWGLSCGGAAECSRNSFGALGVDQLGGSYSLQISEDEFFRDGDFARLLVDPAALASDDPRVATIEVETTDSADDLVAEFELTTGGRTYTSEIETSGGVGTGDIRLVFDIAAAVTWLPTPGWELESHDCPGEGATATLDFSTTCRFRLARRDLGDRIPLTLTNIETANKVATNFGDLGLGELFSVSGANGVGVYRADTFGLVPALSEIGGFNLRNVLGALFPNAPGFPNDGRFSYLIPSGSLTSQYFPEIPGFGASLFGFSAVRDATYVDGDPDVGRGVFATASGVQSLSFQDFGAEYPFLTSNSAVSGAPPGYSITSAFQTTASSNVLFVARSNTAGANGRIFNWTGIFDEVSDAGVDPRLLRCASAVPGTWICVAPNYESANVSVAIWDGAGTAAGAGTLATGPNPLVPGIAAANGEVRVLVPSYTGDVVTALRLDGATGAEVGRQTHALPPGSFASSALLLNDASTGIVTLRGSSELQIIRNAFGF